MSKTKDDSTGREPPGGDVHVYGMGDGSASETVYTAVAELTDRSPMELVPLAYTIDPDALDAIVAAGEPAGPWHVSFEYEGYRVTVTAAEVRLEKR